MSMSASRYVEHLGQQIQTNVAELRKQARCPTCGNDNLKVIVDNNTVHIMCETPVGYEDGYTLHCSYTNTIGGVSLGLPPFSLKFAADDPRVNPIRQRKTVPRRSTVALKGKQKPRRSGKVCE